MQSIQLRYKKSIQKVRIVSIDEKHFILLNEIHEAFHRPMSRFIRNGEPLGIALDEKLRPLEPRRIEVSLDTNQIIDCEKDEMNKFDSRVRDEDQIQLLTEVRKMQGELGKLDRILGNTELLIEKADAILRQTFELAEYTVPRLFIILPEHKTTLNPANWWTHTYRLYFICECESERHFAFHQGYKIKQPRPFFRKYGPYLKNMLTIVRVALSVSGFAMPQIGSLAGVVDQLPAFLFEKTFQEGLARNLNKMVDVVDNALNEDLSRQMLNDQHGIDTVDGAELREIGLFLQMNDVRGSWGNLHRSTNERGEVRWLCVSHYRTFSSEKQLENLRRDFRHLGGELRLDTAMIDQSSVKKLDEMFEVLCRGLSIFKIILINCQIPMKTFKKLLFIATQRNLIHHIEFRDVIISSSTGFFKSHMEIIHKFQEAIKSTPQLTIQYIVSSEREIFEKKISLSAYFAMHSSVRLLLELRTKDMVEHFACSGLSDADLGTVRQWIRENQSSWKIRLDHGNHTVFTHPITGMKESLLTLINFLLKFSNLRRMNYYHAAVNDEVLQTLCEALGKNKTSLEALHFNERNASQPIPAMAHFMSMLTGKITLPDRIGSICAEHIIRMFKENKSLTEITFPSIAGLQFNDMLMIAQAISTHSSISTVNIGALPSCSTHHTLSVFAHLLQNPSVEDLTCMVNGDEEFYDLRNALEKNKTLKKLSIEICNLNRTEINEGFCQYISRIPTLETLILSFSSIIDCSRLLRFLATKSLIKNLSLTRVSNWQSLINFINNGWKLTSLTLSHCEMPFSDIESFAISLKANPQSILELNLSNNNLSDDCATKLASLLLRDSFPLTILNLSKNSFTLSCILNIIRILQFNTSLKILDIRSCIQWNQQQRSNSTGSKELKKTISRLSIDNELVDIQWVD